MKQAAVMFLLLAFVASVNCQAQCPVGQMDAQVLILGAGMAGLGAAETLSDNGISDFIIIDQRDKVGGRIQTVRFGGGIVELGPQWLARADADPSDQRHPLYEFVNRCNVAVRDVPFGGLGSVVYNRTGAVISPQLGPLIGRFQAALAPDVVRSILDGLPEDEDMSLSQGLRIAGWNPRLQLEELVEVLNVNFNGATSFPAGRVSYRDFADPELVQLRDFTFATTSVSRAVVNYPGGFSAIPECLADEFLVENDPRLILETAIAEIEWSDDCVCAISSTGTRFCAPYAILTFSIGELQNGFVKFTPTLPMIKNVTLNQLEMGHFLKIYIAFNETFWDTNVDIITYFNEIRGAEYYPVFITWGAQFPNPTNVLEALVMGLDESKRIAHQDPEITRQEIAQVMRDIYGDRASEPVDIIINNFIANPFFFGNIFAAVVGVGRRQFDEMNTPCGNLYFSGDAITFDLHSLAHGALTHGRETGARIVEILQGPLEVDFINDTPRVEGNTIAAEFRTSKEADSFECIVPSAGVRMDCSSGQVSIPAIPDGCHILRVVARSGEGSERAEVSRRLTVSTEGTTACGAHLLNDGVSVNGGRATIQFSSSGIPVSGFMCSLDNAPLESCESPLDLREIPVGPHRLRIDPVCAGTANRVIARFNVEE